jgi:hypothetical protein
MLSTWDGDLPMVHVVVYGATALTMPLWDAYVSPGMSFEVIPQGEDHQAYAKARGGFYAFGWYFEKPIKRREPQREVNNTPFSDQLN